MKTLGIDKEVYFVPESWSEVSINKWRSLISLQRHIKEDMSDSDKLHIQLSIISCLTDIPYDVLIKLPGDNYKTIIDLIKFYYTDSLDTELTNSIMVDDKEYKLIPFNELTLGDRANIDIIRDTDTIENRIGRLMAILYRYEGEGTLGGKELDEKELLFNEKLSINDVYATSVFFLSLLATYTRHTQFYTAIQEREKIVNQMPIWKRIPIKIKHHMLNIITIWRLAFLRGKYSKLKKYSI